MSGNLRAHKPYVMLTILALLVIVSLVDTVAYATVTTIHSCNYNPIGQQISTNGACTVNTTEIVNTEYTNAGPPAPLQSGSPQGSISNLPVTAQVVNYNQYGDNGAYPNEYLITCPYPPNPTYTQEYFNSTPDLYIGGNVCLASRGSLQTSIGIVTTTSWNDQNPASSQVKVVASNLARPTVQDIAYSGETCGSVASCIHPILASGYNSQSYIYNGEPAQAQYGIWAWYANYADLNQVNNNPSEQIDQVYNYPDTSQYNVRQLAINSTLYESTYAYNGQVPIPGDYQCTNFIPLKSFPYYYIEHVQCTRGVFTHENWKVFCNYTYNFQSTAQLLSIKNANISVPSSLPQSGSTQLKVNGQSYGQWTFTSTTTVCAIALYEDILPSTACGGQYAFISRNGEITGYGGGTEYGVMVYAGPGKNQYTTAYCLGGSFCGFGNNVQIGIVGSSSLTYKNVSILPYFLYNISMPAISTTASPGGLSYLNLSFDLYSPQNYLNPSSNLEPFPIDTGSVLFANMSTGPGQGQLAAFPLNVIAFSHPDPAGFGNPAVTLVTSSTNLNNVIKNTGLKVGGLISAGPAGKYGGGSIDNPAFITAAPNDYIYILNKSNSCGPLCVTSSTNVMLYIARLIPQGYYNTTNTEPNTLPPNTTVAQWQNEWRNYWANITAEQSQSLYIVNYSVVSTVNGNPFSGLLCGVGVACNTATNNLAPSAIATDYGGDIFIMGQVYKSSSDSTNVIGIAEIHAPSLQDQNKVVHAINTSVLLPTANKHFLKTSEFAVSPGGQAIYIASPTSGNILLYSVGTVNTTSSPATQAFSYASNLSLSYSNSSMNLNISKYMEHGGPFDNSQIASAYTSFCSSGCSANDISSNHVPLGIAVYQGVIYVLDDWNFGISNSNNNFGSQTLYSNILMLRAFLPSGKEMPISASQYPDTQPSGSAYTSSQSLQSNINNGFPPYGWPLSVNISTSATSTVNYCAVGCSNNPNSQAYNGFPPIGPLMPLCSPVPSALQSGGSYSSCISTSNLGNIGMSSDFNGTDYIMANIIFPYGSHWPAELLAFKPSIENYTKLSLGASSPYTCYTGSASTTGPCNYNIEIASLRPPVIGVPSSFEYVESQGTPSVFLAPGTSIPASGAIGSGGGGSNEANTTLKNNGDLVNGTGQSVPINNLPGLGSTGYNCSKGTPGCTAGTPYFGPVNLTSSISGYVLVPYNVTYELTQTYTDVQLAPGSDNPQPNPPGSDCQSQNGVISGSFGVSYPPYYQTYTIYPCDYAYPQPPQNSCSFPASNSQTTVTQFAYGQVDTKAFSPTSSITGEIEGGPTYLEQSGSAALYNANLSDASMIIPPYVDYALFTNRVFGEIYVNQTFGFMPSSRKTIISPPYTLEGFQNQTYRLYYVTQGSHPGYAIEESYPMGSPGLGVTGLQSSSPYYYLNNLPPLSGFKSGFNYSTIGNTMAPKPPVELFTVYHTSTHLNDMILNLTGSDALLGYNRLIYTYVDRFNNTIYMPLSVDFANITTIQLSVNANPNVTNPNETKLYINGTAGFETPWAVASSGSIFHPLPAGMPIYLYYDNNLNFYNPNYNDFPPIGQPPRGFVSKSPGGLGAYLEYGLRCAYPYNALASIGCMLANPSNSTPPPTGEGGIGALEGNLTTFATQFNQSGACTGPPTSLLQTTSPNCNIYNSITAVETIGNGEVAYCVPEFSNGTGTLSSQLGLMKITKTNSAGQFSFNTTVCGIGPHSVTARYYGYPYPEPATYQETPIGASGGASEFSNLYQAPTQEYNYSYSANYSVATFQIGLFQLEYGDVSAAITILVLISAAAAAFYMGFRGKGPKTKKQRRK